MGGSSSVGEGCTWNWQCEIDYDADDKCFMEHRDEGFCYDGTCQARKKVGELCRNSGGNADNNNCVSNHCDGNYGVCRAFNDWWSVDHFAYCTQFVATLARDPTGNLYHCEGDCDTDSQCSDRWGASVCYHRNYANDPQPPGCVGSTYENWDYCVYTADLDAAPSGDWNPNLNEPDAMPVVNGVHGKDRGFEVKIVFPGPEYAVALVAIFALLCFVWTVLVRRCRTKPQFQVVSQCEDSQDEDQGL